MTPLMYAAYTSNTTVAQILLEAHAQVNARMRQGITALMLAAQAGFEDVIKLLLAHKAEVDAKTPEHDTALLLAAERGQLEAARLLLAAGADPNARNDNHDTPLSNAEKAGQHRPHQPAETSGRKRYGGKAMKRGRRGRKQVEWKQRKIKMKKSLAAPLQPGASGSVRHRRMPAAGKPLPRHAAKEGRGKAARRFQNGCEKATLPQRLIQAVQQGDADEVETLLATGGNPNAVDT